jgi:GrpB-like predicted nucleotidyltransferase (UPF0157 family)
MEFGKGYDVSNPDAQKYHLHLRLAPTTADGQPQEPPKQILFRDYLRAHPDARERYAQLKRALAAKYEFDREKYTDAKGEFVAQIVGMARKQRAGEVRRASRVGKQ